MEAQHIQAGRGWEWIKQGYALFMKAPLLWIVLLFICLIAAVAVSNIPVVGEPLVSLLMPVILVGLMSGCRSLAQGEELELAHLFSGFYRHTAHLVTLGGISLVGQYLIFGVMILAGGNDIVGILMSNQPNPDPNVLAQAVSDGGFAMILGLVLFSLLMTAMQFAPVLVFFNDVTPLAAMRLSLRAFLYNIGAMLVYGITFMVLTVLASLPMMLGWLMLLPIVFTSLYASYCDIFPVTVEAADAATGDDARTPEQGTF